MSGSCGYGFNTPPSEEPTPQGIWGGLKENTTAHGIPHINNAKGVIKKALWSVICLTVLGCILFHLYSLFDNYLNYKVNVHIDMVTNNRMVFPAVTICNMNPIKNSLISKNEALSFLLSDNGGARKRRKRQTSGSISLRGTYYDGESWSSYTIGTYSSTVTDLGSDRDKTVKIVTSGESAWVVSNYGGESQFFCPGTYRDSTSAYTVLEEKADALYKISHACGQPMPATGTLDTVSSGSTCNRDYTISCDLDTPFKDSTTTKTLTCTATFDEYGGSMDMSQISDCFDGVILYENSDKTGANYIVTSDGSVDFHWENRASTITVTGPSHWVLFKDSSFSTSQDYYSFCPGEYQALSDFDDNSINSMTRGVGPLCPTIQTFSNTQHSSDTSTSCWTVTYTCDSGYSFNDGTSTNQLTCTGGLNLGTGMWNGNVPSCEADTTTLVATTSVEETTALYETTTFPETSVAETTTFPESTTAETTTVAATTVHETTSLRETTIKSTSSQTTIEEEPITITFKQEEREDFVLQENLLELLADMQEEEKASYGYQSTDMLLDCAYEGRNCDIDSDFSHYYNPVLGNCYIYNSGWDGKEVIHSHRTGQRYGLSVVINIDQSEYTDKLTAPAGARIVVHDQRVMPFPNDLGILARPGELLSIGVRKVDMIRKPHPYGNCTSEYQNDMRDMYVGLYDVEYSEMGCTKTCYQQETITKCGCGDPNYPLSGNAFDGETVASCSIQDLEQVACQLGVERAFITGEVTCECRQRCSESYFSTDVSTAQWPAQKHQKKAVEELVSTNIHFNVSSNFSAYENLLKIEIYFQEFNLEEIVEKPAYLVAQLISDLGGAFGLWFGLSILSFFEFFEFFMDLCVLACFRCTGRNITRTKPVQKAKQSWEPPAPRCVSKQSINKRSPPPPYNNYMIPKERRVKPSESSSGCSSSRARYLDYIG